MTVHKIIVWLSTYVLGYLIVFAFIWASISAYSTMMYAIHDAKEPEKIWTYFKIEPQPPYYVGEPMEFKSTRWSSGDYPMKFQEVLRCNYWSDYVWTFNDSFIFSKWIRVQQSWYLWGANEFIPKKARAWCFLESLQTINYHWIEKSQIFNTLDEKKFFDILPRR